ncbi:hypothetical protein VPH35_132357 [Triticum aestivum]
MPARAQTPPPPRAPPPRRAALFVPSLLCSPLGRRTSQGRGRHGRRYAVSSPTTARGAASPARAPSRRARSSSWAASHATPSRCVFPHLACPPICQLTSFPFGSV